MISVKDMQKYYAEIAPKLTNYLVANGCSYEFACDLVQDSFIKLWNKRSELTENDSISGLVFQIAKNLRIDRIRHAKFEVLTDDFTNDTRETETLDSNFENDQEYLRKCLQKALQELPEDLRNCYTMFNIGELSIKDIAEQLSISESLVKVRIHRAKEKLAESLAYLKKEGAI